MGEQELTRSALRAEADRLYADAKSYLPALSVYYHTGYLPKDEHGKIARAVQETESSPPDG